MVSACGQYRRVGMMARAVLGAMLTAVMFVGCVDDGGDDPENCPSTQKRCPSGN